MLSTSLRHFPSSSLRNPLSLLARREAMSLPVESSANPADPGTAFKLLLSCPSGLPASRVSVKFDSSYDRIPHPDASLEESLNEIWSQRVQKNPSLYNGLKFRYGGHTIQNEDDLNQISSVCLHLGLTDYRTFVGTNLSPSWERFLVPSTDDFLCCQHTSSPLGNGAIVETSDGKILVLQRSHNVGEFPGYFVFPGGHSEPQEIGVSAHCTDKGSMESELLNQKITMEMFDGIVREVVEEIGVPAKSLTSPLFIGISRRLMNVRPTAFFFLKCSLEAEEVRELYSRAQDGYESTQIFTVSRDDLKKLAGKMAGCHRGGHALYELMTGTPKDN
ncbi:nudix hydrolase 9 isoform X1 [Canna indica]|uniref:Nudix hydrolase 9 isoform X1 n=1 Tax=Canna indica TaxID=4628 RepID=A0AAQ3QAI2_9LILI|nr:nudix hydrolase 9 isoform X1 [Canna indica]